MNFTIVVDYGKPFEINVTSENQLRKELRKLRKQAMDEEDDNPFFDVMVYDEKDNDVTDKYINKDTGEVQ